MQCGTTVYVTSPMSAVEPEPAACFSWLCCGTAVTAVLAAVFGDSGAGSLVTTGIGLGQRADEHRIIRHVTFTTDAVSPGESTLCVGSGLPTDDGRAGIVTKVECLRVDNGCPFPVRLFLYGMVNRCKFTPLCVDASESTEVNHMLYDVEAEIEEAITLGITAGDTHDALMVRYRLRDGTRTVAASPQTPVARLAQKKTSYMNPPIFNSTGVAAYAISREDAIDAIEHISGVAASIQVSDLRDITATVTGEEGGELGEGVFTCVLAVTIIPCPLSAVQVQRA